MAADNWLQLAWAYDSLIRVIPSVCTRRFLSVARSFRKIGLFSPLLKSFTKADAISSRLFVGPSLSLSLSLFLPHTIESSIDRDPSDIGQYDQTIFHKSSCGQIIRTDFLIRVVITFTR